MNKKITVLKGDGIGPEVIEQALKVLDAIAHKYKHNFTIDEQLLGAVAIDQTGEPLPQATIASALQADAVLLGAIGDPKYDNDPEIKVRPEQGLLALRKALALHTNIRPTTIYPSLIDLSPLKPKQLKDVDFVIYRELSSGIYFGEKGYRDEDKTVAYDVCAYTQEEVARICRLAFVAATKRRRKVTLVDKANVLESSRLWRRCFQEIAHEFPDVETDFLFVDNAAMQLILNPAQFDVIVTSNMFGDILSDEASILSGSIGLAPSSSIGESTALFEPIHGSYPQAAGQDIANPFATILSVAMMLDYFELSEEANEVRRVVEFCISNKVGSTDIFPSTAHKTSELGDKLYEFIIDQHVVEPAYG